MSIQPAWQQTLDFFATPIILEPSAAQLSSDAGLLPFRHLDQRLGLTQAFAAALDDPRDPDLTEHTFLEMVRSRVYGILADYMDQNDHDTLRTDPIFKLIARRRCAGGCTGGGLVRGSTAARVPGAASAGPVGGRAPVHVADAADQGSGGGGSEGLAGGGGSVVELAAPWVVPSGVREAEAGVRRGACLWLVQPQVGRSRLRMGERGSAPAPGLQRGARILRHATNLGQ